MLNRQLLQCDSYHPPNERAFEVSTTTILRSGVVLLWQKRMTNMTKTEIKHEILTDAELDGVVGGLNPQPLPPEPPPEGIRVFVNRAQFARFSIF